MNNIAIILDALAMVLGVSYALLALAEDFFQYISGHQAARTICFHVGETTKDLSSASPRIPNSLTTCHGMAVHDLVQFFPAPVKWTQYIDDIMLPCEYLPLLQDALQGLLEHLRGRGWTVKLQKIQGPVTTVRFQMCLVE